MNSIMKKVRKIGIVFLMLILIVICYPFYILYAFGKALCSIEEFSDYFTEFWSIVTYGLDTYDAKIRIRNLMQENQELKSRLEGES